jgi:hypothetical protein
MDAEQFDRMIRDLVAGAGSDTTQGFSRRGFLKVAGGAAGGLVLGLSLGVPGDAQAQSGPPPRPFAPGAFVRRTARSRSSRRTRRSGRASRPASA